MIGKMGLKGSISALVLLFFATITSAQTLEPTYQNDPSQRVEPAPASVFTMFRAAGMKPVNHKLTAVQQQKVNHAFALLPPLHQRILQQHLQSISFMDNMPNTALTSPVDSGGVPKQFNITFRVGLLDETISEWASKKENTCFTQDDTASYKVRVEGGDQDAIIYVLMHEATHIVDAVLEITPHAPETHTIVEPTPFTKDIWRTMNKPVETYTDSLLEQTRFRSGQPLSIRRAPDVYRKLARTPFASLYGMAAWFEDIAELATIYHLTTALKQPFYVVVTKNGVELARFEPMRNPLVRQRLNQLNVFYTK